MSALDGVLVDGGDARAAGRAAARVGAPLLDGPPEEGLVLAFTSARVELRLVGKKAPGPVWIELAGGDVARRVAEPGFASSPLARAVGATKGRRPRVVDATAGLGTDAALLAALGCDVLAVERDPVLAELWRDAIRRGAPDNLRFGARDARSVLADARPPPDVAYLDPMFPPRNKRALVKKEMQVLQRLHAGAPDDAADLLAAARAHVGRVVVKRPKHAPDLADGVTNRWVGSVTRFDVYVG